MNFKFEIVSLFFICYIIIRRACRVYPNKKHLVNFQNNCPQLMTQIVLNCSKVLNCCSKCPQRIISEHQLTISDYRSLVNLSDFKKNKNRSVEKIREFWKNWRKNWWKFVHWGNKSFCSFANVVRIKSGTWFCKFKLFR